ncbi:MAG: xanthine dehydrogenase family protein molybdopterin-binding subunit [Actinomycetota bacterium]
MSEPIDHGVVGAQTGSGGATLGGHPDLSLAGRPRYVGAQVTRVDNDRPLTGQGTFVSDIQLAGTVEMAVVRSTLAHALIKGIEVDAARGAPGILAVATASDLEGVSPFPDFFPYAKPVVHFPLAREKVRYVGAPVVAVVGEDRYQAEDAAELVDVSYEELPAVSSIREALADNAPRLYEDWPDNRMVAAPEGPSPDEVKAIFEGTRVVRGTYTIGRHTGVPIETRSCLAEYRLGRLTLWTTSQLPHVARTSLSYVLPLAERDIRVIAPDVGGGFGVKQHVFPEDVLVCWLAMRLGRPVRYVEDRAEHMVATVHARDEIIELEAAVDDEGRFLAVRGHVYHDLGSGEVFYAGFGPSLVTGGHLTGPYRIDHQAIAVTAVVTNKTPAGSFRGYGVPEAVFALERLVDKAAQEIGVDPMEARRKMLLTEDDLPYVAAGGSVLDSGSFQEAYERAVELGQASLDRARDRFGGDPRARVGLGIATYREGTAPTHFSASGHWTGQESASIAVEPDGSVTVASGATTQGQGVTTYLATLAADALGVGIEQVRVVMGDTDLCPYGLGAWGSRSAVCAGGALLKAAAKVRQKALRIAGHMLETSVDDLAFEDGRIAIRGADRAVTLADVSQAANVRTMDLPPDEDPGLEARAFYQPPGLEHVLDETGRINGAAAHANATHAAVVRVDLDTGAVELLDYIVVHDCGPIINPPIVEGQIVGGVAHGIGGALYEDLAYGENGQPLSASFMDYLIPTATEIPVITLEHFESPSPKMPLGVKGVGEGGTIGVLGAVGNAVAAALSEFGVDVTATPLSPAVVRRLVREGEGRVGAGHS